jgi:antitoxin (DNA-binding transcriptional repressor) of toxin-antitoxin stability system
MMIDKKAMKNETPLGVWEKVLAGQEVIIEKTGKPVARLVQYKYQESDRQPGALKGKIKIASGFDELPSDIADAFGVNKQ